MSELASAMFSIADANEFRFARFYICLLYTSSTQERERIQTEVEKEDFLLSQIDEFREKAKQLQDLLAAKENKVQELQSIVNEREGKAEEWQHILVERQEEADKIVTEFTKKVDDLADQMCIRDRGGMQR